MKENKLVKTTKLILRIIFLLLLLTRIFFVDRYKDVIGVFGTNFLVDNDIFSSRIAYLLVYVLRFLVGGATISLLVESFFEYDFIKKINSFFTPAIYLVSLIFIKPYTLSYCSSTDHMYAIRMTLLIVEAVIGLVLGLSHFCKPENKEVFKLENPLKTLFFFAVLCVCADYCFSLQFLFGNENIEVQLFNYGHILLFIIAAGLITAIMLFLGKRDKEYARMFLLCLAIGTFIRHFHYYDINFDPFEMRGELIPLNLCHVGILLMPIVLITQNRRLAMFTIINSVMGGIIAIAYPSCLLGKSITDELTIHFIFNHVMLVVIPNLMFKYNIFEDVQWKDMPKLFGVTSAYFGIVCFANTVFPNFHFLHKVSYFAGNEYTAHEFADLIPGMINTLNYKIQFSIGSWNFTIYYLWWIILFAGLILLCSTAGYGLFKLIRRIETVFEKKNAK